MTVQRENVLLQWALWYAKRGWPVIALHTPKGNGCSCGKGVQCHSTGKHPRFHKTFLPNGPHSATTDEAKIRQWWKMWPDANIGIATGKKSFDVLDVDKKGDGADTLSDFESKHGHLPDTIEQITGSGGRQIMFTPTGAIGNEVRFASGLDTRSDGGLVVVPPSLHPCGRRYEWEASSSPADNVPLARMPDWLIELVSTTKSAGENGGGVDVAKILSGVSEGERDQELFRYACRLRSKGLQMEEARSILLDVAGKCKPPFDSKDALRKLAQAWKYPGPEEYSPPIPEHETSETNETGETSETGVVLCNQDETRMKLETDFMKLVKLENDSQIPQRNINQEVMDWLSTCDGTFTIRDITSEFRALAGSLLYNNIKLILYRLQKQNIIERSGSVRGIYRKKESTLEEMNWWDVCLDEFPLVLPLDLHDLSKIMPKSVIVIAGEQNAAKSAFALNIAKDNCRAVKTHYFNSEMSPEELKERLMMFDDTPPDTWRKVKFYPRSENFHDVIFPDDLNVIDYLQVNEDFWKVGVYLRSIFDRLRQGVAVVNLQKPKGRELGRGDSMSNEIARLYVSLSLKTDTHGMIYNEAKIIKAKLLRNKNINPNGMVRNFRLYAGAKINPITEWIYEKQRR